MAEPSATLVDPGARSTKRRRLNTAQIVFLVVAAAAPLAALIGNMPLALRLSGPSMPSAFLFVGIVLLCFAVGYASISREIVSTGAFYTYIARGLGKTPAVMAAYVAVISYNLYAIGLVAGVGYFTTVVLGQLGLTVRWELCSAVELAIVAFLGYRSIDLNAKALATLMVAEIAILLVFDVAVIAHKGAGALPAEVWLPGNIFRLDIGAALTFAVVCFVGFESAALYGEESKDPTKSVPLATYASLALIAVFYLFTVWCMIGAIGVDRVRPFAIHEGANLMFTLFGTYVGSGFVSITAIFFITSVLAATLALHNAASRYMFALGRDRLLPSGLAAFHARYHSPHVASLTQALIDLAIVGGLALFGVDPYLGIATSMISAGTVGIIALQATAAFAIVGYFRKRGTETPWTTTILPAAGGAGLTVALVLVIYNYSYVTVTSNPVVDFFPVVLLAAAIFGFFYAGHLRRNRPDLYGRLAESRLRADTTRRASVVSNYTRRYCIVGAGPSGLILARALKAEGVPFDCFEKHSDVGGIWDPSNTGSPMYESAHFISSKWTSSFYGFPMPDDYPDYPTNRQILNYIRSFADAFGLREHITFNTEVRRAERDGEGWIVELSNGERRSYAGILAAPGVTWYPSVPAIPGIERFAGDVRHSVTYRSSEEFRGKRVLIVGAGNSGVDIACDAARAAAAAFISVRRGYRFVPKHLFGIPTDVFILKQMSPPKGVAFPPKVDALLDALNGDLTRLGLPKPDHDALTSHPIMNTQILHHLAHGDITAKADVREFKEHSVVFKDGSEETIDVVILATGYDYRLPFLDPAFFEWRGGRPQLYLNILHRSIDSLYVLGFTEFADAAYKRFDDMAAIIVADIHSRETGQNRELLLELRRSHFPDLRGGIPYIDSPRHTNYVDSTTFQQALGDLRRKLGWPDPGETTFAALRVEPKSQVPEAPQPVAYA
jgi:cation diffusion facilitator CzcD-associated flavoprotein CzcO/amino acid transporter